MSITIERWWPTLFGGYEQMIERCGRVSHRSETKIHPKSYEDFMKRVVMLRRDHSVAEHVAFRVRTNTNLASDSALLGLIKVNPFVRWIDEPGGRRTLLLNGRHVIELGEVPVGDRSDLVDGILSGFRNILPTLTDGVAFGKMFFCPIAIDSAHATGAGAHPDTTVATYFIKGISRVTEVQDVRHRMRSYTVMSGRTVDVRTQPFVFPTDDPTVAERDFVESARQFYGHLRDDLKMKAEDARYYIPQGFATEMVVTASVSIWKLWLGLRLGKGAQWEIRSEAGQIRDDLVERFPEWMEGV